MDLPASLLYHGFTLLIMPALWRIFRRAGLTPALSLLTLLPLGPFVIGFILTFSSWPAERLDH